ncbi:hypothetical protein ACEPAG_1493 [Sanghuangporus baumii]
MLRYSSSAYPDEAMSVNTGTSSNMRTIPPVYFRPSSPSSPLRSRASTFAMPHMPIPVQLQVPSVRSSASSAASNRSSKSFDGENEKEVIIEREREKERERQRVREREERKVPTAPAMRRGESSSTSSSSGSSGGHGGSASYFYRQEPAPQLHHRASTMTATATSTPTTTPPSSSSSSRTRSRRQSINQAGSSPYPVPASASRRRNPGEEAATRDHNNINNININNGRSGGYNHPDSIPHLREALSSLESQMASLEFEKQRLETKLENAVRQQVPVHRLPRELLGAIFEIGVHSADAEDAVLLSTLMRVCKTWTDVALNTPVLWSRILIDSPASLPKARRKLARSRAVPLDITIQFSPSVDPEAAVPMPLRGGGGGQGGSGKAIIETVVHAMDLLQPALWRWRSFRLAVPTHAHAAAALSQCTDAAPLLEVLAVQVHHVMHDSLGISRSASASLSSSSRSRRHAPLSLNAFMDEDAGTQLFGGHTPRLRKCALTSFDAGWGGPLMQGLTVLRLGGFWNGAAPGVRTLVEVLRACPALEELALRNMSDVEGETVGSTNESCACYDFDGSSKSSSRSHSHSHSHSYHGHTHAHSHTVYPRESEMVHLPRLKSASFYYSGQLRTTALLAYMSFPALERLEFAYLDNLTPAFAHLKRQACSIPAEWERDEVEVPVPGRRTSRRRMSRNGSGTSQEELGMMFRTGLPLKALRIESCLFNELKLVRLLRRFPTLRALELVDVEDVSASFLNGLSTPISQHTNTNEWICPLLDTLSFDGCSALPWDALRALVEARLPAADSASARLLGPASARSRTKGAYSTSSSGTNAGNGSSASGYAAQQQHQQQQQHSSSAAASSRVSKEHPRPDGLELPRRIRVVDLTRCPQISKEMIAWLRMYVSDVRVRREAEHTYWGEGGFAV